MEVTHFVPESFATTTFRKQTPLPLGQLVEETRKGADVPHHLLETKIFAKLQGNCVIQAEPSVLHFSGFELGKDYQQVLKLINITSEVINVHIIPTQTKYFQTQIVKKHRLVPGLSYTVKVHFCPDEWRYFYDCIRVHCKGDENLLVPVHAYPVIDDLDIPSHVSLPPVPLGQSLARAIPLSCSCPVDFQFQVYVIQPHQAFSIQPLSGIIPANGKVKVFATFTPFEYGTAQTTLKLVVSQFNSKPYVCTLTGSSSPYLALRQEENDGGNGLAMPKELLDPRPVPQMGLFRTQRRLRPARTRDKPKKETGIQILKPQVDISTPAAVAKILIQHPDKMSSRDLRQALSQTKVGSQTRQVKEAFFVNKVRQNVLEEKANHLKWKVHLGKDPVSKQTRMQILAEREMADHKYEVKRGERGEEEDLARSQPRMSVRRVLRNANQLLAHVPKFCVYSNSSLEIRHRALWLFQQAARKVLIRCRMDRRLVSLRQLAESAKRRSQGSDRARSGSEAGSEDEISVSLKLCPDNLFPFTFPNFLPRNQVDQLVVCHDSTLGAFGPVPVKPIEVSVVPHVPFFKLKVPQRYKLMEYLPVSAFEASASYIPFSLARPLRTGAQDELLPAVIQPAMSTHPDGQLLQASELDESPRLSFRAPPALLQAPDAHPLRVFNPAPGLHAFKTPLPYLESDPEFHLCPLPKYTISKRAIVGMHAPSTQKQFLDRTDVIRGVMTWKKFLPAPLSALSSTPAQTSSWARCMSDPFNNDLLPDTAPPALDSLPEELKEDLLDRQSESTGVVLSFEMLRAEFLLISSSLPRQPTEETAEDDREWRVKQLEGHLGSQENRLGAMVQARLTNMKAMASFTQE